MGCRHGCAGILLVSVITACDSGIHFVARRKDVHASAETGKVRALLVDVISCNCDGIINVGRAARVDIHARVPCCNDH